MQVLPIDIVEVIAVFMALSIVLIPIIGLTARFALRPVVESFAKLFDVQNVESTLEMTERRTSLMEQRIEGLEQEVRRLREAREFDDALAAGQETRRIEGPREG